MTENTDFTLSDFLPYLLNRAAEESSAEFARFYKDRYGLLRTEWRVLFHLGQFGEMTATEIGTRSKVHKTKISRAVTALQKRRLLARTPVKADRRSERIKLTSSGQKMFEALAEAAQNHNARLLEGFSEAERDILKQCLQRLIG